MRALALVIGVIFAIGAVLAFSGLAHGSHTLGFDGHVHIKHGILYAVIAVLAFLWARMSGARI